MSDQNEMKEYARSSHRLSFLMDTKAMEMYVDYGSELSNEEMTEAGMQIIENILDHMDIPDRRKAAQSIIDDIQDYIAETSMRS